MARHLRDDDLDGVLRGSRVVAVLGASARPERPGYYVPAYLREQGYRIRPVNPAEAGTRLHDATTVGSLGDVDEPVDVVDVFRRPDQLAAHLPEILAMRPLPRVVWLQSGIRDDAVADALVAAGIDVVQDRCMLAEHRRRGIGPV
jgi:predicted CoA-binding protein